MMTMFYLKKKRKSSVWCLFDIILCVCLLYGVESGSIAGKSLYTEKDKVPILYTENVTSFIVNNHQDGRQVQLVQFYNSYCGHCISFAPIFKDFLKSVTRWSDVLSVSVLDCSVESNNKACRDFDIAYYPTLRTFWFKPDKSNKGEELLVSKESVQNLRHGVLKWVTDNWNRGGISPNFPHLPALTADSKENLTGQLHLDQNKQIVIVVEKHNSFLGRELMMDFSKYFDEVKIYRIEESSNRLLDEIQLNVLDTFKLPFLLTINNNDKKYQVLPKQIMSIEDDYSYFTKVIAREFVKNYPVEQIEAVQESSPKPTGVAQYSSRIYMSDLTNAIRYALFHEVPLKKHLDVEQTNTLIRFLTALHDNLHFQNEKTKRFMKHTSDWLTQQLKKSSKTSSKEVVVETSDLLTTMTMYEEYYHLPEHKEWHACADVSHSTRRSYPCSLWTLFHVLTVAEYRHTMQKKQWLALHSTLYAMRSYIKHFFGCTECANHFASMASTLEDELTFSNSSVLWLWHSHNKVNARLKNSRSEDPRLPKRQFPTYQECAECYRTTPDDSKMTNATAYLSYFNEEKTLQFLVNFYSAERIVPDKSEYESEQVAKPNVDRAAHSSMVTPQAIQGGRPHKLLSLVPFTSTDYSIIILFYVVSVVLLCSLFCYLKVRRSRKNSWYMV